MTQGAHVGSAGVVLFDIDGTLLSLGGLGRRALARAMTEEWGIEAPLDGVSLAGSTDGALARQVGGDRPRAGVWRRYLSYLSALAPGHGAPLPGVPALLDALVGEGARLGLLTGNLSGSARIKLEHVGLWRRFEVGLSAFAEDDEDRGEMAACAVARAAGAPVVIVGDSLADVRAARHVGAPVLITATGVEAEESLRAVDPDLLVSDLTDTARLSQWLLSALQGARTRAM